MGFCHISQDKWTGLLLSEARLGEVSQIDLQQETRAVKSLYSSEQKQDPSAISDRGWGSASQTAGQHYFLLCICLHVHFWMQQIMCNLYINSCFPLYSALGLYIAVGLQIGLLHSFPLISLKGKTRLNLGKPMMGHVSPPIWILIC